MRSAKKGSASAASAMLSREESSVKDWSLNSGNVSPAARLISCFASLATRYFSSPAMTYSPGTSPEVIVFFKVFSLTVGICTLLPFQSSLRRDSVPWGWISTARLPPSTGAATPSRTGAPLSSIIASLCKTDNGEFTSVPVWVVNRT